MRAAAPLLGLLLVAGCTGPAPSMEPFDVGMPGVRFFPENLTVPVGTTVVWRNNGTLAHTVTSLDGGPLGSPTMVPDQTYRYTFAVPGTFAYYCQPHAAIMRGTVSVVAATS